MDSFRVKHVVNEVVASLATYEALPDFDQHARKTCREVATLLLEGEAGYNRLNIAVDNYQGLRTHAERAQSAVLHAAARWNADRAHAGDAAG